MRFVLTFVPLLLSVLLLQCGTGGVAPLDVLSGLQLDFTPTQIGLLGSAHFAGFFVGCWFAPRLMGSVGHSRAFAAFAGAGTIGILAHMMWVNPYAWAVMRMASGLCVAGCYTIIEAWLHARVTNENRGTASGIYRVADIGGSLMAQLFIAFLEPASFFAYNLLAIFCCAALFPLSLTRSEQPSMPEAPRLRPWMGWRISPLAAMGVVSSGITGAAFRMVGPIYGAEVGLSPDQIALFLVAYVGGGAVAQGPIGWLADRMPRRRMLILVSVATIGTSLLMVPLAPTGWVGNFVGAFAFGFTTFPLYSIAAAHAHDMADDDDRVELTASLMFLYALGAIASPYLTSVLIGRMGATSMFVFIAIVHVALLIYGLYRSRIGHVSPPRTPYVYTPRTSFLIGRLLGRPRDK